MRLRSDGAHAWTRQLSSAASELAYDVASDADGNAYVLAAAEAELVVGADTLPDLGVAALFLASLDASGDARWAKQLGAVSAGNTPRIVVSPAGELLVVGDTEATIDLGGGVLTSSGDADIFVGSLSATGAHLWSQIFQADMHQRGAAIAAAPGGSLLISGYLLGSVDFGSGPEQSSGAADFFVARLFPPTP